MKPIKKDSETQNEFLTTDEVAAKLRVSRMHLYRMRRKGDFVNPAIKSPLRWRLKDIDAFLDKNAA